MGGGDEGGDGIALGRDLAVAAGGEDEVTTLCVAETSRELLASVCRVGEVGPVRGVAGRDWPFPLLKPIVFVPFPSADLPRTPLGSADLLLPCDFPPLFIPLLFEVGLPLGT